MKITVETVKPIPGFSCLKMKPEIQEKNYRETKHLTKDELRKRLHEKTEKIRQREQNGQGTK
jgi:hypothetical protein